MNHVGRLLVATPLIGDPNFERTVILLLAHGDAGAFGVVLNRPSGTDVAEIIPEWADAAAEPKLMFIGGPVGANAVDRARPAPARAGAVVLATAGARHRHGRSQHAAETSASPEVRLFAGSAGWAAGQLEDELAEGAWWLVDVAPGTCFVGAARPVGRGAATPARSARLVRQPPRRPQHELSSP